MMNKLSIDQVLEDAFFQLAYLKLQEKLHNLLPYLIGFEVVNKNEDNTKALGIFGFSSNGNQILYVPVFFVNGSVQGMNLLYSRENEQFYPLNEDFAELLLHRGAGQLGSPSVQSRQELAADTQPVDFRNLTIPPRTGKYSYASVIDYVKSSDNNVKKAFYSFLEKKAEFLQEVLRYYPLSKVAEAVAPLGEDYRATPETKVDVITPGQKDKIKALKDHERSALQTNGYLILDKRQPEECSEFYGVKNYNKTFTNPEKSGVYTYITETGGLATGLVIVRPKQLQQGFSTDDAIIVSLEDPIKGRAYLCDVKDLYVKEISVIKDYSEFVSKLENLADLNPSATDTYMLLNNNLRGSQPFRVIANLKDANGVRRLHIEECCASCFGADSSSPTTEGGRPGSMHDLPRGNYYEHPKKQKELYLVPTKTYGESFSFRGNVTYIPKSFKVMRLQPHTPAKHDTINHNDGETKITEYDIWCSLKPGGTCALLAAMNENSIYPFTLRTNGSSYFVDAGQMSGRFDDPISAKIAMVTRLGLREKVADTLLKSAIPDIPVTGTIKLAYLGDTPPNYIEEAPYMDEFGNPTYTGIPTENILPPDNQYTDNPTRMGLGTMADVEGTLPEESQHVDPALIDQAVELSTRGQKEIFDTAAIGALARYSNSASKIEAYTPCFLTALDKLGRLLFLSNWDYEKFEELYGREDMPEFTELLKNVFNNLGDLVLFLKNKNPEITINMSKEDQLGT